MTDFDNNLDSSPDENGTVDDPRLTAYVLDELSPEDRADVEAMIDKQPELAGVLSEIRQLTQQLSFDLPRESAPELSSLQRDKIVAAAATGTEFRPQLADTKVVPVQTSVWSRGKTFALAVTGLVVIGACAFVWQPANTPNLVADSGDVLRQAESENGSPGKLATSADVANEALLNQSFAKYEASRSISSRIDVEMQGNGATAMDESGRDVLLDTGAAEQEEESAGAPARKESVRIAGEPNESAGSMPRRRGVTALGSAAIPAPGPEGFGAGPAAPAPGGFGGAGIATSAPIETKPATIVVVDTPDAKKPAEFSLAPTKTSDGFSKSSKDSSTSQPSQPEASIALKNSDAFKADSAHPVADAPAAPMSADGKAVAGKSIVKKSDSQLSEKLESSPQLRQPEAKSGGQKANLEMKNLKVTLSDSEDASKEVGKSLLPVIERGIASSEKSDSAASESRAKTPTFGSRQQKVSDKSSIDSLGKKPESLSELQRVQNLSVVGATPVSVPKPVSTGLVPSKAKRGGGLGGGGGGGISTPQFGLEAEGIDAGRGRGAQRIARRESKLNESLKKGIRPALVPSSQASGESYAPIIENEFIQPRGTSALSTFSVDVDTAAYANVRRFLNHNQLPPKNAVRIEELVNYFDYGYKQPADGEPFSVHLEVAECPWNSDNRLVQIGLQGREILKSKRPPVNLVFLVDVSGSMRNSNKLPLVKSALEVLAREMTEDDRLAIVTYAGQAGLHLASTAGNDQSTILSHIRSLSAGGSTNGEAGIRIAYETAIAHFQEGGMNRVVLCTDGDFNVGVSSDNELVKLITEKARSGVFLSIFGFGMGNLKDSKLEGLADKGNGHYGYIDSMREADKVFGEELTGTLFTIAKDVKIQVEFNPSRVAQYRLIGYENRKLKARDFANDKKDAGEIGAGHRVTALYEVVPGSVSALSNSLKYQAKNAQPVPGADSPELLTVSLRYKQPDGVKSKLMERPLMDTDGTQESEPSAGFRWAAAVTSFGLVLRDSKFKGDASR